MLAFVPEFGRLTCKVQILYHRFTADIHVLRCRNSGSNLSGNRPGSEPYLEALRKNEVPGLSANLFIHDLGKDEAEDTVAVDLEKPDG